MPVDPAESDKTKGSHVAMQGTSVDVPPGWEVRIRQGAIEQGGVRFPVLHASTDPLPGDRADYGGGVVERLKNESIFIALVEFGPEAINSALYPMVEQLPRVTATKFHPFQLQRRIIGQAGSQTFFTYAGRAFCLYVVIGSFSNRVDLARKANEFLSRLSIEPR